MKRYDCVIRVDAGPGIGLGHLNRSTTLAAELQKRGLKKIILMTRTPGEIRKHFRGLPLITFTGKQNEAAFWGKNFSEHPPRLALIDSYRVPESILKEIKKFLPFVVVMDDYHHLASYPVDAVINYNATASKINYRCLKNTRLLLGLRYALINLRLKRKVQRAGKKMRLYVSLGGSPEIPDLKKIAAALRPLSAALQVDMARGLSDNRIPIRENFLKLVAADKAQASMVRSDAAFAAVGVTAYELGMLGIPAMLAVTAINQEAVAREIDRLGFFTNVGWLKKISVSSLTAQIRRFLADYPARVRAAAKAKKIFDGKGSRRLASELIQYMKDKEKDHEDNRND